MWTRFKAWLEQQSSHYPPRWWWPVVRIYGGPEGAESRKCYMTRVLLGPATRWGQLYLHVFHREDIDRDPHDHPFAFWTMPLNCDYFEEVYEHRENNTGCFKILRVPRWRISYRPAEHTHRIVNTTRRGNPWPLVTLVWRSTSVRKWGFWCHTDTDPRPRYWVHYLNYLDRGATSGPSANVPGIDEACPGHTTNLYYHTNDRIVTSMEEYNAPT